MPAIILISVDAPGVGLIVFVVMLLSSTIASRHGTFVLPSADGIGTRAESASIT
jgi:hypothetical protein